jgi:uncharacterized protein (TIGR03089 family)
VAPIQSVAELLASFRSAAGAPRLIWYGPDHERVELSGRVLENWVAKTSNMLVEELDAAAGTVVAADVPPHWKSLVWALAGWQVGAVTLLDGGSPADLRLTMEARDEIPDGGRNELYVFVAPGALDLRWPGTLPDGAVDYAATVRSYGDVYPDEPADAQAELVRSGGAGHTFTDLLNSALVAGPEAPSPGVWLVPASLPLMSVLSAAVGIWADGSTVVLVHPSVEVTERLVEGERITARLDG